jgi:oxygen-independent coproporphyrinogen-3 oxidase
VASIYIHFPWCLAKCPYCDFVSYATEREDIDHAGYADAVIREAEARACYLEAREAESAQGTRGSRPEQCGDPSHPQRWAFGPLRIASVFFGGGTPSLWDPRELGRVLERLRSLFRIDRNAEVTVECNPTSLDEDRARALVDVGANRLSIGTQSLRAEQLRFLGRLHDPAGARDAVASAMRAGVPRVSTDLIFGLPGQTPEDAREQAEALADSGLSHLSCYQLTIEPGTQFGERKKRGLLPMAEDSAVADSFLAIDEALEKRGLRHYEISNYARPGEEARHNLAYWRGDEYVGLGCGAFGYVRKAFDAKRRTTGDGPAGIRWRNAIVPKDYVERTRAVRSNCIGEEDGLTLMREELSPTALLRERIMLGLRVAEGVDLAHAARDLGLDPWTQERLRTIEQLIERGRITREGDVLRIPRAAWLFTDDVASRLF